MAMVSTSHKFIYISGGRNATGAIKGALIKNIPNLKQFEPAKKNKNLWNKFNKHMPARHIKNHISPEIWDQSFKFTFVRNTYSWVISSYFFWVKIGRYKMPQNKIMNMDCFERTVKYYKTILGRRYDECSDIRSQHSFISDSDQTPIVDFIGRFEFLQKDFNKICKKIGVPPITLAVRNSSAASLGKEHSVGIPWQEHYRQNPEAKELVYKNWKRDIDAFNFKLEK